MARRSVSSDLIHHIATENNYEFEEGRATGTPVNFEQACAAKAVKVARCFRAGIVGEMPLSYLYELPFFNISGRSHHFLRFLRKRNCYQYLFTFRKQLMKVVNLMENETALNC